MDNVNFPWQTQGLGSPVDDWSVTAKQLLLGFAQQIKLPDRYVLVNMINVLQLYLALPWKWPAFTQQGRLISD